MTNEEKQQRAKLFALRASQAGEITTEVFALRAKVAELEADRERLRAAALRIVEDKYLAWGYAGGLNDCAHGYGEGIPCRKCDEATIRAARKETL